MLDKYDPEKELRKWREARAQKRARGKCQVTGARCG